MKTHFRTTFLILCLFIPWGILNCSNTSQQDAKIASDQAQLAITLAEYTAALDTCRSIGKDAGSYAIYEKCANDADIRYGRTGKDAGK